MSGTSNNPNQRSASSIWRDIEAGYGPRRADSNVPPPAIVSPDASTDVGLPNAPLRIQAPDINPHTLTNRSQPSDNSSSRRDRTASSVWRGIEGGYGRSPLDPVAPSRTTRSDCPPAFPQPRVTSSVYPDSPPSSVETSAAISGAGSDGEESEEPVSDLGPSSTSPNRLGSSERLINLPSWGEPAFQPDARITRPDWVISGIYSDYGEEKVSQSPLAPQSYMLPSLYMDNGPQESGLRPPPLVIPPRRQNFVPVVRTGQWYVPEDRTNLTTPPEQRPPRPVRGRGSPVSSPARHQRSHDVSVVEMGGQPVPPLPNILPEIQRGRNPRGLVRENTVSGNSPYGRYMYFDMTLQEWRRIPDNLQIGAPEEEEQDSPAKSDRTRKRDRLKRVGKEFLDKLNRKKGKDGKDDRGGRRGNISLPLGISRRT